MALGDQAAIRVGIDYLAEEPRRGAGTWRRALRIAFRKPLGAFSLAVIVFMGAVAIGAPVAQRYDPIDVNDKLNPNYDPSSLDFGSTDRDQYVPDAKSAPSLKHWFGTDENSRDLWARIVWGARRSLGVGVTALIVAVGVGSILGIISGYFGGWFDTALQRVLDAIQAIPPLLLLILAATSLELSLRNLILTLGFVGITQVSRLIRGTVLSISAQPFVEAARVLGAQHGRIMVRHVFPNTVPTLIVVFTVGLPVVIIAEAALTFLGLTPPAPKGSWGEILSDGVNAITVSPWQALFAGGAITLAVLAFNLAGDALRDVLDPRLRV
jgi:peptide/nickel transport system permease protein